MARNATYPFYHNELVSKHRQTMPFDPKSGSLGDRIPLGRAVNEEISSSEVLRECPVACTEWQWVVLSHTGRHSSGIHGHHRRNSSDLHRRTAPVLTPANGVTHLFQFFEGAVGDRR